MKFFRFICFVFFFSSAHAQTASDLQAIADTYDFNYVHYENFILSFQDRQDVMQKLTVDLQNLTQMPSEVRKTRLWSDLYYFINGQLNHDASCKPFYWNFEPYYWASRFLDLTEITSTAPTLEEFNKQAYDRIEQAKKLADATVERLDLISLGALRPTSVGAEPIKWALSDGLSNHFGLAMFESELPSLKCDYCSQIDVKALQDKFKVLVLPSVTLANEKFNQLLPTFVQDTPLVLPPSIRESCYDATLRGIYSELTGPMILKKGEEELSRAEREMLELLNQIGEPVVIPMSIAAFIEKAYEKMSMDPKYQIADSDEYQKIYEQLYNRMMVELPKITSAKLQYPLFFELQVFDPWNAKSAWYNFNKEKLEGTFVTLSPPTFGYLNFELAWLFFHEGVPGHHLEQSLSYDASFINKNNFRKNKEFSPYIEGWGLYVEELAMSLGFYQSAEEKLASLDALRLRALRLMNAYHYYYDGWSDEQAAQLTDEHLFGPHKDALDAIARPRHWSGQAVGYMVGKTILLSMNQSAHRILGKGCFTLQEYNDSFLIHGSVHLDTLVAQTAQWIGAKKCYRGGWSDEQIEAQLRLDIRTSFGEH